ncbi:hypothetical protein LWI29_021951 [Acer saccharum]|uniref:Uncharacterized protein n=1 Tax=Acer saccharum TaxID=4024 RepID=A0AA39TUK6_ACESA|nr:hypothetical protein LWI29_021951 [Acer saccharum]
MALSVEEPVASEVDFPSKVVTGHVVGEVFGTKFKEEELLGRLWREREAVLPVDSKAKKRKFKQDHIKTTTTIDGDSPKVFDGTGDSPEVFNDTGDTGDNGKVFDGTDDSEDFDSSPTTPASRLTLISSIEHSSRQSI